MRIPAFCHAMFSFMCPGKFMSSELLCATQIWKNISAPFIFAGGDPLILFKCADKITQVIKSVPVCDLRDGIIGGGQLAAGLLDPLAVEIIHRSLMGHLGKEAAEILGRHGDGSRKLLQGNGIGIVLLDKFHHLFQLDDTLVITPGFPQTFKVVMITKNQSEKVVKLSKHNQLISRFLLPEGIKKRVYRPLDIRMFFREMVVDQKFLVADLLHIFGADGIKFQKHVHIENNALIDTILRNSGMQNSAVDKNHISGFGCKTFFV